MSFNTLPAITSIARSLGSPDEQWRKRIDGYDEMGSWDRKVAQQKWTKEHHAAEEKRYKEQQKIMEQREEARAVAQWDKLIDGYASMNRWDQEVARQEYNNRQELNRVTESRNAERNRLLQTQREAQAAQQESVRQLQSAFDQKMNEIKVRDAYMQQQAQRMEARSADGRIHPATEGASGGASKADGQGGQGGTLLTHRGELGSGGTMLGGRRKLGARTLLGM